VLLMMGVSLKVFMLIETFGVDGISVGSQNGCIFGLQFVS